MQSSSFRALLAVAIIMAMSLVTSRVHAQTPYRDPGSWCSVTFPKDWKQATQEKAAKLKKDSSVTVDFRAGFAKSLKNGELELPLAVLITSTDRIAAHAEGILGPIWRTPALAHGTLNTDRHYWLPGGPPRGVFGRERKRPPMPPGRVADRSRG